MRTRTIRMQVWLNEQEKKWLQSKAKKCSLSQEAYIRALISGYVPKETPPLDFHFMMRELNAIGNNLNQIAARANATGYIQAAEFKQEKEKLQKAVLTIQEAVLLPEKM